MPDALIVLVSTLSGVLGLLVGSFLNVVIYRVPNGQSIVSPPSACPRCAAPIKPFDNVPVLSWIMLRGKCRSCKSAISARYPLVELGTALFFGAVAWWTFSVRASIGSTPGADSTSTKSVIVGVLVLIAFLYLAAVTVALALIDLDTHRLPNAIVLPAYVVGLALLGAACLISGDLGVLIRTVAGLAALWAAYFAMALAYPGGMGLGDVKLAGVLGLFLGFLGWGHLAVGAFAAFLLGGAYAVGLMIAKRASRKTGIPFGPWMLTGAWVGIFFGAMVWDGYLTLLGVAQQ
ncbi:prepilin peptidase [Cryobacterium cryoconiti]|uniref:Prepilin leader peptidase/N-methyltransferase n=1 Tax=Cryobacterium cryoconiti TaxID=1259239 RepID=A0A4Y8JUD7_9MICO|nr:prepilin peptidase [Cryobacterium cryoconiti]